MTPAILNIDYPLDWEIYSALQDLRNASHDRSRKLIALQDRVTNWDDRSKVDEALSIMARTQAELGRLMSRGSLLMGRGIIISDPERKGCPMQIELRREANGQWAYVRIKLPEEEFY